MRRKQGESAYIGQAWELVGKCNGSMLGPRVVHEYVVHMHTDVQTLDSLLLRRRIALFAKRSHTPAGVRRHWLVAHIA